MIEIIIDPHRKVEKINFRVISKEEEAFALSTWRKIRPWVDNLDRELRRLAEERGSQEGE